MTILEVVCGISADLLEKMMILVARLAAQREDREREELERRMRRERRKK